MRSFYATKTAFDNWDWYSDRDSRISTKSRINNFQNHPYSMFLDKNFNKDTPTTRHSIKKFTPFVKNSFAIASIIKQNCQNSTWEYRKSIFKPFQLFIHVSVLISNQITYRIWTIRDLYPRLDLCFTIETLLLQHWLQKNKRAAKKNLRCKRMSFDYRCKFMSLCKMNIVTKFIFLLFFVDWQPDKSLQLNINPYVSFVTNNTLLFTLFVLWERLALWNIEFQIIVVSLLNFSHFIISQKQKLWQIRFKRISNFAHYACFGCSSYTYICFNLLLELSTTG